MSTKQSASEYLIKSEAKFKAFKKSWESFAREAPQKFLSLVKSGIKPTVSRGPSSPGQISVSLNFESNMDAAKRYVEEMKRKIEGTGDELKKNIEDIDKNLQFYLDDGIDEETFSKLVKHLNDWVNYIPKMTFEIGQNKIGVNADSGITKIKNKWKDISAEEVQKNEAKKYGIELSDLSNHRMYLEAKEKISNERTSAEVANAKKTLLSIKGYLDSADLAAECDSKIERLLAKEEAEQKAKVEAARKAQIDRAANLFESDDEAKLKEAISILEKLDGADLQELLCKCKEKAERIKKVNEEKARLKAKEEAEEQQRKKEAEQKAKQKAKDLRKRYEYASGLIACSMYHAVAVKPDGTVAATGKNDDGQCNVSSWRNIIAVDCDTQGTVGLCADGTVRYTGSTYHKQYQCTQWRDIKAIAICNNCIFGLKNNGTVVATTEGVNGAHFSTKPDVTTWHDIIAIRAGENNVLGIKENGSVVAISRNYYGRCEEDYYLNGKKDVVDADYGNLAGGVWLTKHGSCEADGGQYSGIKRPQLINQQIGIVKVGIFGTKPFALLSDGRVIFEPSAVNRDGYSKKDEVDEFIKKEKIEKAIAVKSNSNCSAIVLTEDGRVIVLSRGGYGIIDSGECFGKGFRLFKNFHQMMDEKELAEEKARKAAEEERKRRETLREKGLCQHCGGEFKKGLFGVKCVQCKKRKDY